MVQNYKNPFQSHQRLPCRLQWLLLALILLSDLRLEQKVGFFLLFSSGNDILGFTVVFTPKSRETLPKSGEVETMSAIDGEPDTVDSRLFERITSKPGEIF